MKLLDRPKEYATNSIKPNGDRNRIVSGGTFSNSGVIDVIAANAKPVDHAENSPHTAPNPGINIGNEIVVLCTKIPNASISKIISLNASMNMSASSSPTTDIEPIWYAKANNPRKMKNNNILILFTLVFYYIII